MMFALSVCYGIRSYWLSLFAFSYEQVIVSFYSLLAMISPMAVAKPVIAYVFICRCLNVVDG
jgi:hypothetical protein